MKLPQSKPADINELDEAGIFHRRITSTSSEQSSIKEDGNGDMELGPVPGSSQQN